MTKPLSAHRLLTALPVVFTCLLIEPLASCTSSDFTGAGIGHTKSAQAAGNSSDTGNGGGSGGNASDTAGASGPKNDGSQSGCKQGCCPSEAIAFVDCSSLGGGKPAALNRGNFSITPVACNQISGTTLAPYDTIVYYGPLNHGQASGLPGSIEAALMGGAKVITFPTGDLGLVDHAFYGLTLETAIEYVSNVGGSTVTVTNANTMSSAFSKSRFSSSTLSHLMFPGPFLLVDRSTFTPELETHWCSDLTARSLLQIQMTAIHGFLRDNGNRRGTLIVSTVAPVGGAGHFDFTEPFLAAHLSQPWSRSGNSAQCGLTCSGSDSGHGFTPPTGVGKPVIYLYPTKEQVVDVKLAFDGKLITTYPQYNKERRGWRVRVRPDGQMINVDDSQEYSYIYWNGTSDSFQPSLEEGFVVKGSESRQFLQKTLAHLGLGSREANDMIVYWLPYLERHPYNLIAFANESYTKVARLDVTPKPDAMLRVFMVFKGLAAPVSVKPQHLEPFTRHGFTVVEWGGSEIGGDWHVIQ